MLSQFGTNVILRIIKEEYSVALILRQHYIMERQHLRQHGNMERLFPIKKYQLELLLVITKIN